MNIYSKEDSPLFEVEVVKEKERSHSDPSFDEWSICFKSRTSGDIL